MLDIAWKSLKNRWATALLAVLAIGVSTALILTVEKVRRDARTSFTQTVSGTDLIVGARSGAVPLMLYSVFHIGNATSNISWESVEEITQRPNVAWNIPISLGDSHRGFRVMGTSSGFYEHFRYARKRNLQFVEGRAFRDVFDTVIGHRVAQELGYSIGDEIVVAHGIGKVALMEHENQPFTIVGILEPTGTPVDSTLQVSLEGIEAMHVDWSSGAPVPGAATAPDDVRQMDLSPNEVTALLIGLKSRGAVFREQRAINQYREEPLLAILPGVTLQELWSLVGVAENALRVVAWFVVLTGLINLVSVLLAGLNERRREMAILRASGARPAQIFALLSMESALLSLAGIIVGGVMHLLAVIVGGYWLQQRFGLDVTLAMPESGDLLLLAGVLVAGTFAGCLPALKAYRQSLADGMAQRL